MGGTNRTAILAVRDATTRRVTAAGGITTQAEIDDLDGHAELLLRAVRRLQRVVRHQPVRDDGELRPGPRDLGPTQRGPARRA